jgi:hypothetical protein
LKQGPENDEESKQDSHKHGGATLGGQGKDDEVMRKQPDHKSETLRYLLNILENTTSVEEIRESLKDKKELFEKVVKLFRESLQIENKISLINIIFNLNFNLDQPSDLVFPFLKILYKTYGDITDESVRKKMISIVVVASAVETNHEPIIKSGFYRQLKRNLNDNYDEMTK